MSEPLSRDHISENTSQAPHGRMSIGDVVAQLKEEFPELTGSKIRFLEERKLISVARSVTGYRIFGQHDVDVLRWILTCQRDKYLPLNVIAGRIERGEHLADIWEQPDAASPSAGSAGTTSASAPLAHGTTNLPDRATASAATSDTATTDLTTTDLTTTGAGISDPTTGRPTTSDPTINDPATTDPANSDPAGTGTGNTASDSGIASSSGTATGAASPVAASPVAASPVAASPVVASSVQTNAIVAAQPTAANSNTPAATTSGSATSNSTTSGTGNRGAATDGNLDANSGIAGTGISGKGTSGNNSRGTGTRGAAPNKAAKTYTLAELCAASGQTPEGIAELISYRILSPPTKLEPLTNSTRTIGTSTRGAGTGNRAQPVFDEDALTMARVARELATHGLEPRHLRIMCNAAERDAAMFMQGLQPVLHASNPTADQDAHRTAQRLLELSERLRSTVMRSAMSKVLD